MCWKKKSRLFRTLTFRLTLWYAGLFGGLSLVVFLAVYISLTSSLEQRTDEELLSEAGEFASLYADQGVEGLSAEFQREAESSGERRAFFRLLSPQQEIITSSDMSDWKGLTPIPLHPATTQETGVRYFTVLVPGHRNKVRVLSRPTADGSALQLGMTLGDNELLMERYRETFGTALAVMLICGSLVGWLTARKAMSGVQKVTRTATGIGKGELSRRVLLGKEGVEIEELALAFNEMLERIETLVRELKEVTDNIAHDLRSPLTRIRGIAETTLTGKQDIDIYREMAATVVEEGDRLVGTINTMLEIAQADSGMAELSRECVDLQELVSDARDLFLPVAEDKNIHLESDIPGKPIVLLGDRARLQRVIANLLDNAIKFTPSGGRVMISARTDASWVIITVTDTGVGIDEKDLPRIFNRFFRSEESRPTPGNGLGLSLARSLARAHGGDITVKSPPGKGSVFSVSLPLPLPLS